MDPGTHVLKKISKIALAALGVLIIGALVFYKERIFFADAAYVTFNVINYKTLAIQFNRYGSFISQIVPYLGQKLHLPLMQLYMAYAASFSLFYFTVATFLIYKCRQYALTILMGLYYFLIVSDSYFWISEIPQGIAWMFLLFGVTIYLGQKKVNIFLLCVPFIALAFLTIFTHFVILMPAVFLWVYLIIEKRNWPFSGRNTILLSIVFAAVVFAKFIFAFNGPATGGDGPHLYNVIHVSFKDIFQSFVSPVVKMFGYRCVVNYWTCVIVLAAGIYALLKNGEKFLTAWVLISCLGYFIIIGLAYGDLDEHTLLFHIESEWTCIGIIAATPFVFRFLPGLKPVPAAWILSGIFAVRLAYIASAAPVFSWRIHFQERILAQMRKKNMTKLALYRNWDIKPKYLTDWASGYESLLMSAMNGDNPNLSFTFIDSENNKQTLEAISNPGTLYLWGPTPSATLNPNYFRTDTLQPYQVMTYEDLMK